MISGAGDELQGIKRGLMELADMILVNKSDGENIEESNRTKMVFEQALHYFPTNINNWKVPVETISSRQPTNLDQVWKYINEYITLTKTNDYFIPIESIKIYNGFVKDFPTSCFNMCSKIPNYLIKRRK